MDPMSASPMTSTVPRFEHVWLSLQWHAGFAGVGKGWDQNMVTEITKLGQAGFEMIGVTQQKDPTWFILFFKRRVS